MSDTRKIYDESRALVEVQIKTREQTDACAANA